MKLSIRPAEPALVFYFFYSMFERNYFIYKWNIQIHVKLINLFIENVNIETSLQKTTELF